MLTATVDVPALGISYYAVVGDGAGNSMTVPAAGEAAPQRAWTMPALTQVSLGAHAFGRAKKPHSRVVTATWGSGQGALGILAGRELVRIGPSAFDIDVDGTVVVLDQVNDRLARYPAGGHAPTYTPIAFAGGEGDLALGADGTAFVLDQSAEPVVRSYARSGALRSTAVVTGTGADMLRTGPAGPIVHAYPGRDVGAAGGGPPPSSVLASRPPELGQAGSSPAASRWSCTAARPRRTSPSCEASVCQGLARHERHEARGDPARRTLRDGDARRPPSLDGD